MWVTTCEWSSANFQYCGLIFSRNVIHAGIRLYFMIYELEPPPLLGCMCKSKSQGVSPNSVRSEQGNGLSGFTPLNEGVNPCIKKLSQILAKISQDELNHL